MLSSFLELNEGLLENLVIGSDSITLPVLNISSSSLLDSSLGFYDINVRVQSLW